MLGEGTAVFSERAMGAMVEQDVTGQCCLPSSGGALLYTLR